MESIRAGAANNSAVPADSRSNPERQAAPDLAAIESALDGFLSEDPAPPQSLRDRPHNLPVPARITMLRLDPADGSSVPPDHLSDQFRVEAETAKVRRWPGAGLELVRSPRGAIAIVCIAALGLAAGPVIRLVYRNSVPATSVAAASITGSAASGTATFQSNPSGAAVSIEGSLRGTTPLTLALPVGEHLVEIGLGLAKRQLTAEVSAATVASYYLEFPAPSAAVQNASTAPARSPVGVGDLEVFSDPPGAQVSVDGTVRGVTPLVVSALSSGEHRLTLFQAGVAVNRTVRIAAGSTASVVVSATAPNAAGGWVSIEVPFEMKIFEEGRLLGTTASKQIMLPSGNHNFDLVNEELEFSAKVPVRVVSGRTITANVPVPTGVLSVNALPWAEVLVDGQSVGTTPLGNLAVPIGAREVVWRHPQFGERRRMVTVKEHAPVRVGVDFTQ